MFTSDFIYTTICTEQIHFHIFNKLEKNTPLSSQTSYYTVTATCSKEYSSMFYFQYLHSYIYKVMKTA